MKRYIDLLQESFQKNKDNILVIDAATGKQFTYGEIHDLSLRFSSFLESKGIKKGDHIAVLLPNCVEYMIFYFACMHIGAIPIPVNHRLHPEEIEYILSNSDAKAIIASPSLQKLIPQTISKDQIMILNPFIEEGKETFISFLKEQKPYSVPFGNISDDDLCIIVYTSGTTKRPKGVMIPYKMPLCNGSTFANVLNIPSGLRFYGILSMAYLGGFYNLMLIPMLVNGSIVLDEAFSPRTALHFWDTVKKYKISALWVVPSIMSILLTVDRSEVGREYAKNNIKLGLVGTAPLPVSMKKTFEEKYSFPLYENYGLSETMFISTNSPRYSQNKAVGKSMPTCSIMILNDNGKPCKQGEPGEIAIKSSYVMKGYYKNEEETNNVLRNGTFYTGDVGYLDDEGYLHISDRKKDIIIRGGVNISPKEIEEVIMNSGMANEAAVVGIPHELYGEEIVAAVIPNEKYSEEKLRAFCKNHLSDFKLPKEFRIFETLPKSVTGKVQKQNIRKILSGK
jgi:acyl-CoA synthetase (AMP-forming)/AMP-acid ligase II